MNITVVYIERVREGNIEIKREERKNSLKRSCEISIRDQISNENVKQTIDTVADITE